jgi:uncharacterized repeat protein (TIGR04042 family)
MPVVPFTVTWPDGTREPCSSPSRAITEHLDTKAYRAEDFAVAVKAGLTEASNRVQQKFGFTCSAASDQLYHLEQRLATIDADAMVIVDFD